MSSGLADLAKYRDRFVTSEDEETIDHQKPVEEGHYPQTPMMYRAQIEGRCGLQYAGDDKKYLETWIDEWILPKQANKPRYQHERKWFKPGQTDNTFCCIVKFPYRLYTNGGQDSIHRPAFGKRGIPIIPGSSLKGLFRRACDDAQAKLYCGSTNHPGCLRFHHAYPIGDWAKTEENQYRIQDLVHPQQDRQVKSNSTTTASPVISLYQPHLHVVISSTDSNTNWTDVEQLLLQAIQRGVGGKTSSGYGLYATFGDYPTNRVLPSNAITLSLEGKGVTPKLLNGLTEFRPNLFKATLRSHALRLLGGVCSNQNAVEQNIARLFGGTDQVGIVIFDWLTTPDSYNEQSNQMVSTYEIKGDLRVSFMPQANASDRRFIEGLLQFSYTMGGFGKSWRRVHHKKFYRKKNYPKDIGCHWQGNSPFESAIQTVENLTQFLKTIYETTQGRLSNGQYIADWRESWHPDNVEVFSKVVTQSQAISLFHEEKFKFTPAIGGKNEGDKRPKNISSVWHRMLPIAHNQYLEIITVFKQGDWKGNRRSYIDRLTNLGFQKVWGN